MSLRGGGRHPRGRRAHSSRSNDDSDQEYKDRNTYNSMLDDYKNIIKSTSVEIPEENLEKSIVSDDGVNSVDANKSESEGTVDDVIVGTNLEPEVFLLDILGNYSLETRLALLNNNNSEIIVVKNQFRGYRGGYVHKPSTYRPIPISDDSQLFKQYLAGVDDDIKTSKKSLNVSAFSPFNEKFAQWDHIGVSYIKNPKPPLYDKSIPSITDFLENTIFKALLIGGEGSYAHNVEKAPMVATAAALQNSIMIDEQTIEQIKWNESFAKAVQKRIKGTLTDEIIAKICDARIVIKKQLLNHTHLAPYKYIPSIPPQENDFAKYEFPAVHSDQIRFLSFLVCSIERLCGLYPKKEKHIFECVSKILPILCYSIDYQNEYCHLICTSAHIAFVFYLFRVFAILIEFFSQINMHPLMASFQASKSFYESLCHVARGEIEQIIDNIEEGGSLSSAFFQLRNASIAVLSNSSIDIFQLSQTIFKENDGFLKAIRRSNLLLGGRQNSYIKFELLDSFLRPKIIQDIPKLPALRSNCVPPCYSILLYQYPPNRSITNSYLLEKHSLQFSMSREACGMLTFVSCTSDFFFE